jgi:hypothetical protein
VKFLVEAAVAACVFGLSANAAAFNISFDYSHDTNNFFNGSDGGLRKSVLESAGSYFSNLLTDDFSAINSDAGNHFNAKFFDPASGAVSTINDFSVAADSIVVYAGGREFGSSALGVGGTGSYEVSYTDSNWLTGAVTRGETSTIAGVAGDSATDIGLWGGSIAFDSATNWFFDTSLNTTEDIPAGTFDFYDVALHELGHVLGLGVADSWFNLVNQDNEFVGPNAIAGAGSNVALSPDQAHWKSGTISDVSGDPQAAAMNPSVGMGTRRVFTTLDIAALDDIGYDIAPTTAVPVPAGFWLMGSALLMMALRVLRREC